MAGTLVAWMLALTIAMALFAILAFIYDGRNAFRHPADRRNDGSVFAVIGSWLGTALNHTNSGPSTHATST